MGFEELRAKNLLTVSPSGYVFVMPTGQYSFTSFPLPDDLAGCIRVTQEEYMGLLSLKYMFNDELTGVVDFVAPEPLTNEEE